MTLSTTPNSTFEKPSIKNAWKKSVEHFPAFSVAWVLSCIVYLVWTMLLYFLIYGGLILDLVKSKGGQYEPLYSNLGALIGIVGGLPFWVVASTLLAMVYAIPSMYYNQDRKRVTAEFAFKELNRRRFRYIFAGIFHALIMLLGYFFCIVPGIIVACIGPIYINKIFSTDQSIIEAFVGSFKAVFRSNNWLMFLFISFLGGLIVTISTALTCNIGYFFTFPIYAFYIQSYAYHNGILSRS